METIIPHKIIKIVNYKCEACFHVAVPNVIPWGSGDTLWTCEKCGSEDIFTTEPTQDEKNEVEEQLRIQEERRRKQEDADWSFSCYY